MRSIRTAAVPAALMVLALAATARADERKFTYSYEAKTLPKGTWEFEQWATLETGKKEGSWDRLNLREEVEYGITDRLTTAIYLNSRYQANSGVPGFEDEHHFGFESMSSEWKVKLSDPDADVVGSLLYGEVSFANHEYEIEGKLVLSKNVGGFTFAYNFIYEAEVEEEADESPVWRWEHLISNTLGASYAFSERFAVGVEAMDVFRTMPLEGEKTHAYFVGPNVHYSSGSWWATFTVLRQVSINGLELEDSGNTEWQFRLIFGVNF